MLMTPFPFAQYLLCNAGGLNLTTEITRLEFHNCSLIKVTATFLLDLYEFIAGKWVILDCNTPGPVAQ
jgi:hypothetical protein